MGRRDASVDRRPESIVYAASHVATDVRLHPNIALPELDSPKHLQGGVALWYAACQRRLRKAIVFKNIAGDSQLNRG